MKPRDSNKEKKKQPSIEIMPEIHQNIRVKTFHFRNQFQVSNFAIVAKGTVKLMDKLSDSDVRQVYVPTSQLIDKKGVLL